MAKVQVWQIGYENKMKVRRGLVPNLTMEEEMAGHYPMDLYNVVFSAEVTQEEFEEIKRSPFRSFNRVDGVSGYLERYEQEHGPVEMWSLSVGDIIELDGQFLRCECFGWEDVTEQMKQKGLG